MKARELLHRLVQGRCCPKPDAGRLVPPFELCKAHGGLEVRKAMSIAEGAAASAGEVSRTLRQVVVVGDDHAALVRGQGLAAQ